MRPIILAVAAAAILAPAACSKKEAPAPETAAPAVTHTHRLPPKVDAVRAEW